MSSTFKDEVMTKKEVAAYVGVCTKTVEKGFGDCLQPFKLGSAVLFDRGQVERHFRSIRINRGCCDGNCKAEVVEQAAPVVGSRLRIAK